MSRKRFWKSGRPESTPTPASKMPGVGRAVRRSQSSCRKRMKRLKLSKDVADHHHSVCPCSRSFKLRHSSLFFNYTRLIPDLTSCSGKSNSRGSKHSFLKGEILCTE